MSVSGPDFASLCGIELVNQSAGPMGVQGAALVLDKVLGKVLPRWPSQLSLFGLAGAAMIVAAGARGTLPSNIPPSALLVGSNFRSLRYGGGCLVCAGEDDDGVWPLETPPGL